MTQINTSEEVAALARLSRKRNILIFSITAIILGGYLAVVVLVTFTSVLNGFAVGLMSWIYVLALGLYAITLISTLVYKSQMVRIESNFDAELSTLRDKVDTK